MERTEPQSIGDILRKVFKDSCMEARLDECRAAELWEPVVGKEIAALCKSPRVASGVMTVRVANASLRQELAMSRTGIKNAINRMMGKEIIKDIRFVS